MRLKVLMFVLFAVTVALGAAVISRPNRSQSREISSALDRDTASNDQAPYRKRSYQRHDEHEPPARDSRVGSQLPPGPVPPEGRRPGDARTDVQQMMARLEQSGPSAGGVDSRALQLFQNWKAHSAVASDVEFSDFRCYAGGCAVVASYSGLAAYAQMMRDLPRSEEFLGWPGPKFGSGPIQDSDGRVTSTWILQTMQ